MSKYEVQIIQNILKLKKNNNGFFVTFDPAITVSLTSNILYTHLNYYTKNHKSRIHHMINPEKISIDSHQILYHCSYSIICE